MPDGNDPKPTPGEKLVLRVYGLSNRMTAALLEDEVRQGSKEDQVVVMLAAAVTARTFLNARQKMAEAGELLPETVAVERGVCAQIISEREVEELLDMVSDAYEGPEEEKVH